MYVGRLLHELGTEISKVFRGSTWHHSTLRDRLAKAVLATLVMDVVGTALIFAFEHHGRHTAIRSVWLSFFWVTTQLLTVSSQMQTPQTNGGRIVDILLEAWSISVVTAVAGSFAAFLQSQKASPTS